MLQGLHNGAVPGDGMMSYYASAESNRLSTLLPAVILCRHGHDRISFLVQISELQRSVASSKEQARSAAQRELEAYKSEIQTKVITLPMHDR